MTKEEIAIQQKKIWWSVHKEDHEICERLQEGRSSPASDQEDFYLHTGKKC